MLKKEERLSPKVEALYKAVMELLLEGREIRKIKVSEMTERAGIGKGTAYEYFASREELLLHALEYQKRMWAESVRGEVAHCETFLEKVSCLFDLVDRIVETVKREAMEEMCNIFFFSPIFQRKRECDVSGLLREIVGEARRGGELREELPDEYIGLALSSRLILYVSFCVTAADETRSACTPMQVREYLLNSIRIELTV